MSFVEERLDKYVAEAHEWTKKLNDLQRWGLECKDGDFVPSVHYPPITQYPLSSEEEVFEGYTLPADGRTDLYVHFPFCQQHCTFCHYPGLTGPRPEEKEKYLTALEKEFDLYLRRFDDRSCTGDREDWRLRQGTAGDQGGHRRRGHPRSGRPGLPHDGGPDEEGL